MTTSTDGPAASAVQIRRLARQLLAGRPASSVLEVVDRLLAVQAQEIRGARLSVRARTRGLRATDVDQAITADRSVVITTLNRGTLHMVRSEDYWWLHGLTAPVLFTASARRLAQEGVPPADADRGVAEVVHALTTDGPLTRRQLRERVASVGVRVQGQALVHVLLLASLRGLIVRGPMIDGNHAFVLTGDWLGTPSPSLDRDAALAELARRYLAGHGPASAADLARWVGLPLRDARRGLSALGSSLVDCGDGLVDLPGQVAGQGLPTPRLLGQFEPLLLGWKSREVVLGGHQGIVTTNGIFRPFALVRGRCVATWAMPKGNVVLAPLEPIGSTDQEALTAEAVDVERFLHNRA